MFRKAYRLPFRLLGIPILLDVTFLIVLPILAWLIGNNIKDFAQRTRMPLEIGRLDRGLVPYVLGLIVAVGLFISVLIHELGHSIIARLYGVKVKSITLWLLGGMAQFDQMPQQRGGEAVVAVAGPITSFLVAGVCAVIMLAIPPAVLEARFVAWDLAVTNIILAVFNLLPALPLDGGRVLRSLLALRTSHSRATEISANISRVVAVGLGLIGLLSLQLFLILIAFFVYMAVNAETQQTLISDALKGMWVRDLMTRDVKTVRPEMTVGEVASLILQERHRGFPVGNGHPIGVVTIGELRGVDPSVRVGDVMSHDLKTIPEWESASEAFQRMVKNDTGRLIVTNAVGDMVGIVTNTDLMRAMQVRMLGNRSQRPPADTVAFSR